MSQYHRKTLTQRIRWWWNTRVVGFFRIRLKHLLGLRKKEELPVFGFERLAEPIREPRTEAITVILTAYRRVEYLPEQIAAIRKQTVTPLEIWVWTNAAPEQLKDVSALADRVVVSNTNWLFWGRFALGNLARTGYVAFFDDDILPEPAWFENCLATIEAGYDGILGGSGVLLPHDGGYSSKHKAGWNGMHRNEVIEVDLVGHAWFMRKEHLQYMWREEPYSWDNGEDIHLSYMALKHGGIKTYTPPHPEGKQSIWSCRPDFGKVVGRKNVATFKQSTHRDIRSEIVNAYRADGWSIVAMQKQEKGKAFLADLLKFNDKLRKGENFSLVRFGDGEMIVINGEAIDLSEKYHGEHKYSPGNEKDEAYRKILAESLTFRNEQYYVGLPCRCCVGDEKCERIRSQADQPELQLTWANIFVNSNYDQFLEKTVPLFYERTVNLICHQNADPESLPFGVKKVFRVGGNAWTNDYDRCWLELEDYISVNGSRGEIFIFCAGVLSNMLIYRLTKCFPDNTYLDVGSVFDIALGLGKTRKYLKGKKKTRDKVCVW